MKIVFVSNYLNHHQIPFCETIRTLCEEFWFINTQRGPNDGIKAQEERDYALYLDDQRELCEKLIIGADVVIFGTSPNELVSLRMRENKLTFIYSERFLKRGTWARFSPKIRQTIKERYIKHIDKPIFVLSASAYLPYDLSFFGFPISKCYKWGYFPEVKVAEEIEKVDNRLLWAGRMLDWKHPETAIYIAKRLKKDNIPFELKMVGEGPQKELLEKLIKKYGLENEVRLLGYVPHKDLLELMSSSQIYIFSSDFGEGWGAVLNEAMANKCAVVASHSIGAVPYLLKDKINGRIYRYGNDEKAYYAVKELLLNTKTAKKYGNVAAHVINEYNYSVAASRLYEFCKAYLSGDDFPVYKDGILSQAEFYANNWKS